MNQPQELDWKPLKWKLSTMLSLVLVYGFTLKDLETGFEQIEPEAVELEVYSQQQTFLVIRLEPLQCTILNTQSKIDVTHIAPDWVRALSTALTEAQNL